MVEPTSFYLRIWIPGRTRRTFYNLRAPRDLQNSQLSRLCIARGEGPILLKDSRIRKKAARLQHER